MQFSVIIPHKNQLGFLRRCLDSIPGRKDIQVVVVDDNSDVSDGEWATFRCDYPNVELILTKEGKGAGYARNVGLAKAKGKWIVFADADDFFHEGAFDRLDEYCGSDYDVIFFYADSVDGTTLEPAGDRMHYVRRCYDSNDTDRIRFLHLVPWCKMIRHSVIDENNIVFEEIEVSNDVMFSIRLGAAAKQVLILNEPLYCATVNRDSLRYKADVNRLKVRIKARKRANDFLYDNHLEQYRVPFRNDPWCWIQSLIPSHPFLVLWAIWVSRYKGATLRYVKDLLLMVRDGFMKRIKVIL